MSNIGALRITYRVLGPILLSLPVLFWGVPYYDYSIIGPKTLF